MTAGGRGFHPFSAAGEKAGARDKAPGPAMLLRWRWPPKTGAHPCEKVRARREMIHVDMDATRASSATILRAGFVRGRGPARGARANRRRGVGADRAQRFARAEGHAQAAARGLPHVDAHALVPRSGRRTCRVRPAGGELPDAVLPLPQPVRLMGLGLSSLDPSGDQDERSARPPSMTAHGQLALF